MDVEKQLRTDGKTSVQLLYDCGVSGVPRSSQHLSIEYKPVFDEIVYIFVELRLNTIIIIIIIIISVARKQRLQTHVSSHDDRDEAAARGLHEWHKNHQWSPYSFNDDDDFPL